MIVEPGGKDRGPAARLSSFFLSFLTALEGTTYSITLAACASELAFISTFAGPDYSYPKCSAGACAALGGRTIGAPLRYASRLRYAYFEPFAPLLPFE